MPTINVCAECGGNLRFNAEFTYRKEGRKYKNSDWFYCDNCKTNTRRGASESESV